MDIAGWNERYRLRERASEDWLSAPTPLLVETAALVLPGTALDLACGAGRHALWLAEQGWQVTAVDGAEAAIALLRARASERRLSVQAVVADLQAGEFAMQESAWDLVMMAYYLQRDLFALAQASVRPGGLLLAIVHTTEAGEEPTAHRLRPGELRTFFDGWEIVHEYEGLPRESAHRRAVSEIVARRPI